LQTAEQHCSQAYISIALSVRWDYAARNMKCRVPSDWNFWKPTSGAFCSTQIFSLTPKITNLKSFCGCNIICSILCWYAASSSNSILASKAASACSGRICKVSTSEYDYMLYTWNIFDTNYCQAVTRMMIIFLMYDNELFDARYIYKHDNFYILTVIVT